jgi:phosphoglycerol transferase
MKRLTTVFDRLVPQIRQWIRLHPVVLYGGLTLAVVAIWCGVYGRIPGTERFRVPVEYRADALFVMAISRGVSEFPAPWNLHVDRLNAPFGADWNDYPHSEKLLFYLGGTLSRFFDPGAAANLFLLFGFVFNALGFCWAARRLGSGPLRAAAGSIMFAFSTYMLWRGLPHSLLVYAGHIPILFYLCHRLQRGCLDRRALWLWGSIYVVVSAFLNPYYFILGLLMLALVAIRLALKGPRRDAIVAGSLVAEGGLAFLANQSNVFLYRWHHGSNAAFSSRGLAEQMIFGLRLPDLFMPLQHPLKAWSDYAKQNYFVPSIGTDNTAAFLGLVGCAGLLTMVVVSVGRAMRGHEKRIPFESWFVLVAYLFGSVGGMALLLGAFGFSWLRATARYSIVILCAVLLWSGRTFKVPRWPVLGAGLWLALTAFTVIESYDAWAPSRRTPMTAKVKADRALASELESHLPRGAAVFQLPVMGFPEAGQIGALLDYEQFRPYLWSKTLRFSYGTHRGRERERWQALCARKPVQDMVRELVEKGFAAILVHREGFADRGRAMESALIGVGLSRVAGNADSDMVAYRFLM